jgi:hypothetical protein
MHKTTIAFLIPFVTANFSTFNCSVVNDVKITFYGYQSEDNSLPRESIAYSCPFIAATNNPPDSKLNTNTIPNIPESSKPSRMQRVMKGYRKIEETCGPTPSSNRTCTIHDNGGQQSHRKKPKNYKRGSILRRSNQLAGGTGSYNDPLTMASSSTLFDKYEIFYVPYLQKYVRFEDNCKDCDVDAANGVAHINIWTGSNSVGGGNDQIGCEMALSPGGEQSIIRNPSTNLTVNG